MLTLTGVSKKYGKSVILENVSQTFETGVSLLTGPSGTGKSTLLRLCATAEKPSSGSLSWNNSPLPSARKVMRKGLGYAPQLVDLPNDLTGFEFMRHMAALKGLGRGAGDQARVLMSELGLAASIDLPIAVYSGGMRRRLIFAQSLLGAPKLLALDEPTAELDSETARIVIGMISKAAQIAVVIVTTHLSDAFTAGGATTYRVADGQVAKHSAALK
jgi:ABC-type multidrug transport system ATPase subunit